MFLRRVSLVAMTIIALGGASALAQVGGSPSPQHLAQTPTNVTPQRRSPVGWLETLNLTSDQVQKIKTIRNQSQADIKPKREAVRQAQVELRNLLAGNAPQGQVKGKYKQLEILKQQLANVQFENTLAIREVLNPEQRQKFAEHIYKQ
jgi:protein CpxP